MKSLKKLLIHTKTESWRVHFYSQNTREKLAYICDHVVYLLSLIYSMQTVPLGCTQRFF